MRILHVTPYFPPDRVGGVGEVVRVLHEGLISRGHESVVVTTGTSSEPVGVRRVARLPTSFSVLSLRGAPQLVGADVIHAHHGEGIGLLLLAASRKRGSPALVTLHVDNRLIAKALRPVYLGSLKISGGLTASTNRWIRAPLKFALDRWAMMLADQTSFICRAGAIEHLGAEKAATARVIYNGTEIAAGPSDESMPEMADLLYVGTASQRKRTDILPYVLAGVRDIHPRARLRMVGPIRASNGRLIAAFESLGLGDAVLWEGPVRHGDLWRYYVSAGALILPSAYEGLPLVVLEAMRLGTPVVATDVGGVAEALSSYDRGWLVPADDLDMMVDSCQKALASSTALPVGFALDERFSAERQIEQYLELYRELIGSEGASRHRTGSAEL